MSGKQFVVLIIVASLSGIIGGHISDRMASASKNKGDVITAREINIVDDAGKPRATLSFEKKRGFNFVIFRENGEKSVNINDKEIYMVYDLNDAKFKEIKRNEIARTKIMPGNITVSSENDNLKNRRMYSSMYAAKYGSGITVSTEPNDFLVRENIKTKKAVNLGMFPGVKKMYDGRLSIDCSEGQSNIGMGFDPSNMPYISLDDEKGRPRVNIGQVILTDKKSGSNILRPLSSIVLTDDNGRVVWSAP